MNRVSIYVKNKQYKPSNYYRIIQYIDYLDPKQINIHSLIPNFLYQSSIKYRNCFLLRKSLVLLSILVSGFHLWFSLLYDILFPPNYVIIQKSISKINLPFFLRVLLKTILKRSFFIWDFDDNIVYDKEITQKEFKLYCQYSNVILVPSSFLRDLLPENCFQKTILLPTTDAHFYLKNEQDLNVVTQIRKTIAPDKICLIWVATSGNLFHLEHILPILEETAEEVLRLHQKHLVLKVVCDKPVTKKMKYLLIENIKWSREVAFYEQKISHIGIMPLIENEYTKGKAGFKLVQYLSTGLPVIASNVGFNKDHFSKDVGFFVDDSICLDSWKKAILSFIESNKLWENCSQHAYHFWWQNFHPDITIDILKELLNH